MTKTLIFGGGGTLGASYIGVLQRLYEHDPKFMDNITTLLGTSVGALFAFHIILGNTPQQLKKMYHNLQLLDLFTVDSKNFDMSKGFLSANTFNAHIIDLLETANLNKDITFLELFAHSGKTLVCVTTRFDTFEATYFSHLTTPNVSVRTALYHSLCISPFMHATPIQNIYYMDGGFVDNIPYQYALETLHCEDILTIKINVQKEMRKIPTLTNFINNMTIYWNTKTDKPVNYSEVIDIKLNNLFSFDFNLQASKYTQLIDKGYTSTSAYLKN